MKDIKCLINNQTFLVEEPEEVGSATPLMNIYKNNIQYDGSLNNSS